MIVCQVPGDSLSGARCQVQLIDLCHVVPLLVLEEVLYGSCLPLDPGGGASPGGLVTVAEQAGVPGGRYARYCLASERYLALVWAALAF